MKRFFVPILVSLALLPACSKQDTARLLNVSYDPTREFYRDVNTVFAAQEKAASGREVRIQQSHGGSGKQARAVNDGLPAHVVTLALPLDIDSIAKTGLIPLDWRQRLPHGSSPFHSTLVFLVRKGDPKGIRGWDDLLKPGVSVITANPKTSGAARGAYMAAWAWGLRKGGEAQAEAYVRELYRRVPVLDNGARAATTTFAERGLGDVLITWESEAYLALRERGQDALQVVTPPFSLRADLPVAEVAGVTAIDKNAALAQAYLRFLYSPQGQALAVKHHLRPNVPEAMRAHAAAFPKLELVTLEQVAGSWEQAQARHFAAGGLFDRMLEERR